MNTARTNFATDQLKELPPLLTKQDAAWATGFSARHIDSMTANRQFPPYVIVGQSRRWRTVEILAWIDAGCPPMSEWKWPFSQAAGTGKGDL